MTERIRSYGEFWPYYLGEHRRPLTRGLHLFGTALGAAMLIVAAATGDWRWLPAALVGGYAFAWIAHAAVERNRPATFTYPLWSFVSDFRMLGLFAVGRLGPELEKYGLGEYSARR